MRNALISAVVAVQILFLGGPAGAGSFTEVGDAGNTPAAAQSTSGTGSLDTIFGTLSPDTDTDVFKIFVADPSSLAITFVGTNLSDDDDLILWVLDTAGHLLFVDDDSGPGFLPQMNAGDLSGAPGFYLVAYNLVVSNPIVDVGTLVVSGWTTTPLPSQTGPVVMNLRNAGFAENTAVPEPSTIMLIGAGAVALFGRARRKA